MTRQYSIPGLGGDFTDVATQTAQAPAPAVNANSDINSVADTNLNVANTIRETLYAGTATLKVAGNIREILYTGTATLKIGGIVRETLRSGGDAVFVNSYPYRSRTYRIR